jgi:hypothetical protein
MESIERRRGGGKGVGRRSDGKKDEGSGMVEKIMKVGG